METLNKYYAKQMITTNNLVFKNLLDADFIEVQRNIDETKQIVAVCLYIKNEADLKRINNFYQRVNYIFIKLSDNVELTVELGIKFAKNKINLVGNNTNMQQNITNKLLIKYTFLSAFGEALKCFGSRNYLPKIEPEMMDTFKFIGEAYEDRFKYKKQY